jgi:hypothetical protein
MRDKYIVLSYLYQNCDIIDRLNHSMHICTWNHPEQYSLEHLVAPGIGIEQDAIKGQGKGGRIKELNI